MNIKRINLLPWREEWRARQKRIFIILCLCTSIMAGVMITSMALYLDIKLERQNEINQQLIHKLTLLKQKNLHAQGSFQCDLLRN